MLGLILCKMQRHFGSILPILLMLPATLSLGMRLISVPDLHGDFERTVTILAAASLIDATSLKWTGGSATLVQTGDITDRGNNAKQIYELFFRLADEARTVGGSVINLLGNHELMNLEGSFDYVSAGDIEVFGGEAERALAWSSKGWLGSRVHQFPVAVVVGNILFAHAGVLPGVLETDVAGLNEDMQTAIAVEVHMLPPQLAKTVKFQHLLGDEGPVWTRAYALDVTDDVCSMASDVLHKVGAVRMVVGHSIQNDFHDHTNCGGRIVLADTAISSAIGGQMSYLEHDGKGGIIVNYPGTGEQTHLPLPDHYVEPVALVEPLPAKPEGSLRANRPPSTETSGTGFSPWLLYAVASLAIVVLAYVWLSHGSSFKSRDRAA